MESWVGRVGVVLFFVGFGCIVGAMAFGAESHSRAAVWFRGAMQRPGDYTSVGWRVYQVGVAISLAGMIAIVVGLLVTG